MNEVKLHACLNTVGKKIFVDFYKEFADPSLSAGQVADIIVRYKPKLSWDAAKTWRCSSARKIIDAGHGKDALRIVIESPRICSDVKERARRILASCRSAPNPPKTKPATTR